MIPVNLPLYFALLGASLIVIIFLSWRFYSKKLKKGGARVHRQPAVIAGGARRRVANVQGVRRPAARMRDVRDSDDEAVNEHAEVEVRERLVNQPNNDDDENTDQTPKKKIGAKKAAKLAEKERRKEEREAEERYREHQRKLEDMEIEKRKKAEAEAEKAAAEAAALEAKRLEEEAAREQAEYEKLKVDFSVEDEGTEVIQRDSKAETEFNAQIIAAIQEAKIIPIEHLALDFGLKTEACVERLRSLLASGQLTGLLDDRGKFIYVTKDEYEAVAQFIEKRGRVTLTELVENGHKLIQIDGSSRH
ncbi:unnamed protein product [Calicophoron daubneyi]|uniref:DDRGK domain-containing protein 1 n=1 Tax=Calicophoron daubneyi TaxID=300641 RepID=A0AAV2T9A7_CALDB